MTSTEWETEIKSIVEQRGAKKGKPNTGRSDINSGTALWEAWSLDTKPSATDTKDGGEMREFRLPPRSRK